VKNKKVKKCFYIYVITVCVTKHKVLTCANCNIVFSFHAVNIKHPTDINSLAKIHKTVHTYIANNAIYYLNLSSEISSGLFRNVTSWLVTVYATAVCHTPALCQNKGMQSNVSSPSGSAVSIFLSCPGKM